MLSYVKGASITQLTNVDCSDCSPIDANCCSVPQAPGGMFKKVKPSLRSLGSSSRLADGRAARLSLYGSLAVLLLVGWLLGL
jgi:hypothetical protein